MIKLSSLKEIKLELKSVISYTWSTNVEMNLRKEISNLLTTNLKSFWITTESIIKVLQKFLIFYLAWYSLLMDQAKYKTSKNCSKTQIWEKLLINAWKVSNLVSIKLR